MANALQEQLLRAGLVNDKQLKKAQKEKRKEDQKIAGRKGHVPDQREQLRQRAEEKVHRDRELNRQRSEVAEQKAVAAQVRQLVDAHRVEPGDGDVPYKFADEGKIKQLYVSDAVRRQIAQGRLAIVKSDGRYDVVAADIATKIRERNAAYVILWNKVPADAADADSEYAAYQVPDDLIW